jgi:putative transposase
MPRKHLIKTNEYPYHVYNRANNRETFYLNLNCLWPIFLNSLSELQKQFGCDIHSFVMMPNHYHLVISTPHENLGDAMKYFHREVARHANRASGRINHFFGGRYKWTVIHNDNYYWHAVKYVLRNPVKAGICESVTEYPYSSLNQNTFKWQIVDFFSERSQLIELNEVWLNEPMPKEEETAIRLALRRREFKLPAGKNGKSIKLSAPHPKKGTVT